MRNQPRGLNLRKNRLETNCDNQRAILRGVKSVENDLLNLHNFLCYVFSVEFYLLEVKIQNDIHVE